MCYTLAKNRERTTRPRNNLRAEQWPWRKRTHLGLRPAALPRISVSIRSDAERSLERIGKMALVTEPQVQRDLSQRKPAMFQEFLCQLEAA